MISTIKQTNFKTVLFKILKAAAVVLFWLFVWEMASYLMARDNELMRLILPSPAAVFKKWGEIAFTADFLYSVAKTLKNVLSGFIAGAVIGSALGAITHYFRIFDGVLSPLIKLIRAVPVVAIIILLYLFFKNDQLPMIIVSLMVMPIMWQTVYDGLGNFNRELAEMAVVYKLPATKTFFNIKLLSLIPELLTGAVNSLGLAWKSGVAAEVICLPDNSLGTILWQSKGNVDYDEVYAVTLTVIIFSLIFEILLKYLLKKVVERTKYA